MYLSNLPPDFDPYLAGVEEREHHRDCPIICDKPIDPTFVDEDGEPMCAYEHTAAQHEDDCRCADLAVPEFSYD